MKLATVALAAAIALSSTAALAQAAGTAGYGTVTAPSVGTYNWPSVGTTNAVPTWRNTTISGPSPSAPTLPSAPTFGGAPVGVPGGAPTIRR